MSVNHINELASIIQVAVAPVFLLAGIAGFLNVMTARLGRVIDRVRVVERRIEGLKDPEKQAISKQEQKILRRRARIINLAIGLCTGSGLLICLLVMFLFINGYLNLSLTGLIVGLFVWAMVILVAALILFLKEVQLGTKTLNIAREFSLEN